MAGDAFHGPTFLSVLYALMCSVALNTAAPGTWQMAGWSQTPRVVFNKDGTALLARLAAGAGAEAAECAGSADEDSDGDADDAMLALAESVCSSGLR